MKNRAIKLVALVLLLSVAFLLSACKTSTVPPEGLWEGATYLADTTLGDGEKTVSVTVEAGESSIVITLKTDKSSLGEALYELGLINDASFFDTLNGIKADFDADEAWWKFYVDGTEAFYGVADAPVDTDSEYKLVYTIGF